MFQGHVTVYHRSGLATMEASNWPSSRANDRCHCLTHLEYRDGDLWLAGLDSDGAQRGDRWLHLLLFSNRCLRLSSTRLYGSFHRHHENFSFSFLLLLLSLWAHLSLWPRCFLVSPRLHRHWLVLTCPLRLWERFLGCVRWPSGWFLFTGMKEGLIRNFHSHLHAGATCGIVTTSLWPKFSKMRANHSVKTSLPASCSDSRTVPNRSTLTLPPLHTEVTAASSSVLFHFIVFSSSAQLSDVRSDVVSGLLALECTTTVNTIIINSTTITGPENKVKLWLVFTFFLFIDCWKSFYFVFLCLQKCFFPPFFWLSANIP